MPAEQPIKVRYECADGVARIVLDGGDGANALESVAAAQLQRAVELAGGADVRCVVVSATGPRFCAGGDLRTFTDTDEAEVLLYETAVASERALRCLGELPVPVVVGVHGAVAGAGLSFVLNADVVVAARSTRFLTAYASVGLTPDCGVSYLLPRVVGPRRALQLMLLGTVLDAERAQEWGLVTEVVDDHAVGRRLDELGAQLAAGPAGALASAKRLVRGADTTTREANALDEARTIATALRSGAAQRRIQAFLS